MYQTLLTSLENGILTVTINRPDKLNALNRTVISELAEVVEEIYVNHNIRAAILTGAGSKSFVAGADISEFLELDGSGGEALAQRGQEKVFDSIENAPKPIVAAVNGFALGGGNELAMACHFRLAADNAKFGQPEVSLGLIPGYGGTQRLPRLIGKGKAMELLLSGAMIDATEALRLGLVNEVTTAEQLLPRMRAILETILSKAPLAITQIIELVNASATGEPEGMQREAREFGKLFDTADAREGIHAFLEKRKPQFKGS